MPPTPQALHELLTARSPSNTMALNCLRRHQTGLAAILVQKRRFSMALTIELIPQNLDCNSFRRHSQ